MVFFNSLSGRSARVSWATPPCVRSVTTASPGTSKMRALWPRWAMYRSFFCVFVFLYIFCTITKTNFVQRYCMYFTKMLCCAGEVPLRQRNDRLLRSVHVSLGGLLLGRLEALLSRDLPSVGCLWLWSRGALTKAERLWLNNIFRTSIQGQNMWISCAKTN